MRRKQADAFPGLLLSIGADVSELLLETMYRRHACHLCLSKEDTTSAIVIDDCDSSPPAGVPHLQRSNPIQRREDYRNALHFYTTKSRQLNTIIFVDNSNSDLSFLHDIVDASRNITVELISYDGLSYPTSYGRAFGEISLIDEALRKSYSIREMASSSPFWKVTGRLVVENIDRMILSTPVNADFYCDLRTYLKPWQELRLFAATRQGFRRYLFEHIDDVRQDIIESRNLTAPEEWLYRVNYPCIRDSNFVPRFSCQPIISGFSGTYQADYGAAKKRLVYRLKGLSRVLFPSLWV